MGEKRNAACGFNMLSQNIGSKKIKQLGEVQVFKNLGMDVVAPKFSTGYFWQVPSTTKQAEKMGKSIGKQFVKNMKLGGDRIASIEGSTTFQFKNMALDFQKKNRNLIFEITGKESKIKSIETTGVKKFKPIESSNFEKPTIVKKEYSVKPTQTKTELTQVKPTQRVNLKTPEIKLSGLKTETKMFPETISRTNFLARTLQFTPKTFITNTQKPYLTKTITEQKTFLSQKISPVINNLLKNSQQMFQSSTPISNFSTPSPKLPIPKIPIFPGIPKPNLRIGKKSGGGSLFSDRFYKYAPSMTAMVYGIKGKKTKGVKLKSGREVYTGFEVRKILG